MILRITIATYFIGMAVFFAKAFYDINDWIAAYFCWEKTFGGGFIVWYLIAVYSKERRMVMPIVWLGFSRFLWEVVCWIFDIDFNNQWGVLILFIILTICAVYACLNKESRMAKFLDKNAP